ncbi:hypothetical protein J7L48_06835, partial [bacterium]|nr:hypothetical protein [bacterium]
MKKKIFKGILVVFVLLVAVVMLNGSGKVLKNDAKDKEDKILARHIVKNGYIIIDGRLFEPPFKIKLRSEGIWVEDVLYQKIEVPVDLEKNRIRREERITHDALFYKYISLNFLKNKENPRTKFRKAINKFNGYQLEKEDRGKIIIKSPYGNNV